MALTKKLCTLYTCLWDLWNYAAW